MTSYEAIEIFEMIKAAYPGIYAKKARDEKAVEEFVKHYVDNFGPESFQIVKAAVSDLIRSSKYPPNISEVLEQVERRKDLAEFEEAEKLDDDKPLSKEDQEAFENALIAFEKVISEG
jgi:hypothetical protein